MATSGTNVCDNAPCEPQINVSLGEEFTISLDSNPSTGFEWWTDFDPAYLSLTNSTFISGNENSQLVGVPGTKKFTFSTLSSGQTDVILLLLQSWENGTIAERKIFPINIEAQTLNPKHPIVLDKNINIERNGKSTYSKVNNRTATTPIGTSTNYFTNESSMETPSQIVSQNAPKNYELSSLGQTSSHTNNF